MTLEQLQALREQAEAQEQPIGELLDVLLLPMDTAVQAFPEVNLSPVVAGYLKLGQAVRAAATPAEGMVRITEGDEHRFIGMGEIDDEGRVAPRRLVVEYPVPADA